MAARSARLHRRGIDPAGLPSQREEPLNAARGLAAGLLMGLLMWLLIGAGAWLCCT